MLKAYNLSETGAQKMSEEMGVRVDLERIYSPDEAAKLCAVHKTTILRAITAGDLKAHRPSPRKTWILGRNLFAYMTGEAPPAAGGSPQSPRAAERAADLARRVAESGETD